MIAKCERNIIAGNYSCEQGQTDGKLDCWSGSEDSWWVMKCEETKIIVVSELLIIRCTAEKKSIFHIHSLIMNSGVEFIHEVYFNHEFSKFKSH